MADDAVGGLCLDGCARRGIAAPPVRSSTFGNARIAIDVVIVGSYGEEMIGEARPSNHGKEIVSERKVLGVLPVVRDIGLEQLRVCYIHAVLDRPADQGELVHLPPVDSQVRILRFVMDVTRKMVRLVVEFVDDTLRICIGGRSVRPGERAKQIVKGAVLLIHDHDVRDRVRIRCPRRGGSSQGRARTRETKEEGNDRCDDQHADQKRFPPAARLFRRRN